MNLQSLAQLAIHCPAQLEKQGYDITRLLRPVAKATGKCFMLLRQNTE